MINLKFKKDKKEWNVDVKDGQTILEIAREYNIDLECACEGSLACSTCHVIFENKCDYENCCNSRQISDEENDMLDLAYGLTDKSRLGCQVKITPDMDGVSFIIPSENRNSAPSSS